MRKGIRTPKIESMLISDFLRKGNILLNDKRLKSWDWYHLMQHYGTPTRLLDWTEVSPIALFFAVRNPKSGIKPVVWVMNPGWLNKLSMRFDIRIQVQLSCFTIHGYIEDGFKEMVKQENNSMIAKLIIESGSAPGKIKYDLGTMGIRESTLFPDPVGLSRELKEEYEV